MVLALEIAALVIGLILVMAQIKLFGIAKDVRDMRNLMVTEARSRGLLDDPNEPEPEEVGQEKS